MRSKRNLTALLVVWIMALLVGCGGAAAIIGPIDENGFSGSGNDYTDALVTDKFVNVDGKFDEDCWQTQKPFAYTYEGVRVSVTTVFGQLGFYVGFTVADPHVYACAGRDVWKGSSVEMYVDRGDAARKSVRTFQYRLDATGRAEMLNGYESKEDAWTGVYLPIFGRTQVQGELNSGSTVGMTAEIFVRWDALGYDYTAEGFTAPQSVKIMPVYNQSSGADLGAPRDFWVNNGGNLGSPNEYWIFGANGFTDADRDAAVIGDSAYGRAKSCGWDVSEEVGGIVKSDVSGDQAIFFTDVYATDYAVTALMRFDSALNYWNNGNWMPDPYPKAGLIVASDTTLQAYVLDYDAAHRAGDAAGMFFQKGNPDPRDDYWKMYGANSLKDVCDASRPVRLTGVKSGRFLLIFAGDENTEKFGGTFVGMREVAETAGKAAPGFYTLGCAVSFTDYAVTEDPAAVNEKLAGILSVLELEQSAGGAMNAPALGYRRGERATITIRTYEGYVLRSVKVDGAEKLAEVGDDGTLDIVMNADKVTVSPEFVRADEVRLVSGTLEYEMKNARPDTVSVTVRGGDDKGRVFLTTTASNEGAFSMRLPDGTYTLTVSVDGIERAKKTFAVSGADRVLDKIPVPLNWVFDGAVQYNRDGSALVSGFNQFRPVKNISADGDFALTASIQRADGNFDVGGTWETGGIGVRVDGVTYRIYVMRENASDVVVYLGIDGVAAQEYRQGGSYRGTGAPIRIDMAYVGREIHLLLDGQTHYILNLDNTLDPTLKKLFTSSSPRQFGFATVGKDMIFSDYDFRVGADNVIEKAMRKTVTLPVGEEGYTVAADTTNPFIGETVELRFSLAEGWVFDSIRVNGTERKSDVVGGVLRLVITDTITVEVEARQIVTYAVSGTYAYDAGLYAYGDTVTVSSGIFTGIAENGGWQIALPDGQHTVLLQSTRFVAETVDVTVEGGAVTVSQPSLFRYLDFAESGYTRGDDGSVTIGGGAWTGIHFAGITAADGFSVTTTLRRTDDNFGVTGTWETGGFTLHKNGTEYVLYVIKRSATEINVYLNITNRGQEGFDQSWESPNIAFAYSGTGAPLTLTMAYTGDTLYLLIGGKTVACFSPEGVRPSAATRPMFNDLFVKSANDTVAFGLLRAAPPEGVDIRFTDTSYAVGAAAVEAAVNAMRCTVTLPDTAHVAVSASSIKPFVGEDVTLGWTVEEGWQLTGIAVNGTDMTDRIVNGRLTVTATENLLVTVTVAELQILYPVTGAFTYAAGLYGDGDTVSVKAGLIEGTVDTSAGTWSIELPDGEYTLTFTSARYTSVTQKVTVAGGNVVVAKPVSFTEIAFTADSTYSRDGDAVVIAGGPWTPAYFAGIDAAEGLRVDTRLERSDGRFDIEGTWGTGGFILNKNGIDYMLYVMRLNAHEICLYFNNKADWKSYEIRAVYSYRGTGAPLDLSLLYLGESLHLKLGGSLVLNFDENSTALVNTSDAYRKLFAKRAGDTVKMGLCLMDMGETGSVRFSGTGYAAATSLPDDWKGDTLFVDKTEVYLDGSDKAASGKVLWLDNGAGTAVSTESDFMMTYSLARADGNFAESGTWNSAGLALGIGSLNYRILIMAEPINSRAAVYLQSYEGTTDKTSVEYWIPYAYAGTGAPITVSVAYTSVDETLHLYVGGTHYAFTHDIKNSADDAAFFAAGSKTLGLFTNYAAVFSNVSYTLDSSDVSAAVAGWGTAATPS